MVIGVLKEIKGNEYRVAAVPATVHEIVELGQLDPEAVVTPGIYVNQVIKIERVATQARGFKKTA